MHTDLWSPGSVFQKKKSIAGENSQLILFLILMFYTLLHLWQNFPNYFSQLFYCSLFIQISFSYCLLMGHFLQTLWKSRQNYASCTEYSSNLLVWAWIKFSVNKGFKIEIAKMPLGKKKNWSSMERKKKSATSVSIHLTTDRQPTIGAISNIFFLVIKISSDSSMSECFFLWLDNRNLDYSLWEGSFFPQFSLTTQWCKKHISYMEQTICS